jgi:two-component system NtrC family sensor kinase
LVIEITDTGPGIREEDKKKIFDPFFTTKEVGQGTGLGLAISYSIIRKHQGTIKVRSTYGEGATFTIALPVTGGIEDD